MGWKMHHALPCPSFGDYQLFKIIEMSSIRDFIPLAKLGEGTYSTVYKVRRISDQRVYALKKVRLNNLSQKQKQNALNEIRILASFECEHIVGYKEAFFDEKLNVLCIVMEFADGGDLHKFIQTTKKDFRSISQRTIWKFIFNILNALKHLHAQGILHRDLKSANIFVFGDQYKLGDLNVSKVNGGNLAYTQTGTPYYASPQVWRDEPYDNKSDIWSFGCIVYEMATLRPPFNGKDMEELFRSVQNKRYTPLPQKYSRELVEFIHKCLQKNPNHRPTASDLLQAYSPSHMENSSLVKQKKEEENPQLLKTIKLPTDMKSLKTKLPQSKYEDERRKSIDFESPKHFMSDRHHINYSFTKVRSPNKIGVSEVFISPKNVNKPQFLSPGEVGSKKTNSAHLNLSQKKIEPSNYSERIEALQNRKIYSAHKSELIDKYDKFIKEEISKHAAIPRTQKRRISNQNGPDKKAIEEWKKKLVKKSRILSNNSNLRPFLLN